MSNPTTKNVSPKKRVINTLKDLLKTAEDAGQRKEELERISEERISYAKSRLMAIEPFFAMLLFKMPTHVCYQISSMATDGTVLLYNPKFVGETLLRKDVIFVLLHEIEHVFLKHNIRGPIRLVDANKVLKDYAKMQETGKKDIFTEATVAEMKHILKEWNDAIDYVVNDHIDSNTSIKASQSLKDGGMRLSKNYKDKTSEYVYDKIKTEYDPKKNKEGGSSGDFGDFGDLGMGGILPAGLGNLTDTEVAAIEKEFEGDVKAAALSARKAGKLPAGIEDIIEDLYTTTTPWQDIFRTIFTSINKQDYTFQYPNRRYTMHQLNHGVIMPSLWGEEYVNVGFIMDTSGSVGAKEKAILVSELKSILEDYPITLHVLYCDTKAYVDNVEVLTQADVRNGKLKLNVKGGGGTDMRPAFDYFRDNQDKYEFETVICLTDMYLFNWKLGPEPPFGVFWARLPNADKKVKPPFGITIDLILED